MSIYPHTSLSITNQVKKKIKTGYKLPYLCTYNMPKRSIDDASEDLIDELREQDEFEQAMETFENERASILLAFETKTEEIKKQIKEPRNERDQVRYETDIGYEETLKMDRLKVLEERIKAFRESHQTSIRSRKRQRVVDRNIRECESFLEVDRATCDWRVLCKSRHVQTTLEDSSDSMTQEQKDKYSAVLEELCKKGWRTLFKARRSKAHGTPAATEQ